MTVCRRILPLRKFLLLLVSAFAFAAVPCMAKPSVEQRLRQMGRKLQAVVIEDLGGNTTTEDQELLDDISVADSEGDGFVYNPCSLCQGLTLLEDKIASPEFVGNVTCGEANFLLENQPDFFGMSFDSCRGDMVFNMLFESCCRSSVPVYTCEKNVHKYMKELDYDTAVPPIVSFDPEDALNVSVTIQYQALEKLEVAEGTATVFLTITMQWKDPRLGWDIEDGNTCANVVNTWTGHEVEKTQIWIPDFQLYNEIDGLQTMPEYKAHVYADGTVVWTISGGVTAFCAFRNLANIPFDTLGCQMIFGGGLREHTSSIRWILSDPDYLFFGAFDVTYNEWYVIPELGEQGELWDGMAIYYNFYFNRASRHYIQNIVIPTIILTYLSFFTFLLDLRVGERLGFGMALALVVVAQQIVTSGMTPISDQALWLDKFVAWSFYWVLIGVIESVMIGFLFYVREDKEARDEAKRKQGTAAEELEPLALETIEEPKPKGVDSEPSNEVAKKKDCYIVASWNFVVYKIPLRKLDMYSLFACLVTYSVYIIIMVTTGTTQETWMGADEPVWFSKDTQIEDLAGIYSNNDPEN